MKTVFYITRSFYPYQKGGGPLMRKSTVDLLRELGWNVVVVMPYDGSSINYSKEIGVIRIPFEGNLRLSSIFQRLGVYEDYLDRWVRRASTYLKDIITSHDIIFSTSGGELGTIKLGSILKKEVGCQLVVNYRDPTDYTIVNGLKKDRKFHVSREKAERKYLANTDLILTSSMCNLKSLKSKYPEIKDKIKNNYFGYVKGVDLSKISPDKKKLKIAYSGSMLKNVQNPIYLLYIIDLVVKKSELEVYFIGDVTKNKQLVEQAKKYSNVFFIDHMPHSDYLDFMIENIDVGFLSLSKEYYGACVPSKLYEYINLGKPIIATLPEGDAKKIINDNKFGFADGPEGLLNIARFLDELIERTNLETYVSNVKQDRHLWSMGRLIKDVDVLLKEL